ncbi:hypothetical protein Tco_0930759 [Tanacetum coccineum]
MVACLERIDRNADFHEIVDFLTASPIHYALTISPTIYASYIEQFWNTVHSQPISDVKQIHATIDGKTILISELLVRSDLHFNDEDGIITPLFASMLAPPVVEGEGSGQPTEPQPAPSTTQPIIEEQIPTSVPIPNVADEAVFKEWDNRVLRATTTSASLDAVHASDPGAKKPWGVSLLRLGLRGHLYIHMIHLSQELTYLEVMRKGLNIRN